MKPITWVIVFVLGLAVGVVTVIGSRGGRSPSSDPDGTRSSAAAGDIPVSALLKPSVGVAPGARTAVAAAEGAQLSLRSDGSAPMAADIEPLQQDRDTQLRYFLENVRRLEPKD